MITIRIGGLASRILLAATLGLAMAPEVRAIDLSIENGTEDVVFAAVGYYSPKGTYDTEPYSEVQIQSESEWVAEGWFKVDPKTRLKVYSGPRSGIFLRIAVGKKENTVVIPEWKGDGYSIRARKEGWPVDWKHKGFRLCYGDDSKRWGLRYGNGHALVFQDLIDRTFRFHYPHTREGASVADVECANDKGFREVRLSDKPEHWLGISKDDDDDDDKFKLQLGPRKHWNLPESPKPQAPFYRID